MSAPYKVMEFVSAAGNPARLKVYGFESLAPAVDVAWENDPTPEEITECDRWFSDTIRALHPTIPVAIASAWIEDDGQRDAVIDRWLRQSQAAEN